ncbi:MAG: sulfatase-like hydrolase/transferase, partial [Verrucomicrobiales bacterium]
MLNRTLLCLLLITTGISHLQAKPNVLVIYTDDHRYTGVHALGGQPVQTPHLDELVAGGIGFTRAYLMGSFTGATCVPSRAMLLTGRNLFQLHGEGRTLPVAHTTLGETMMGAGYHAHFVGKWHQDFPSLARSFTSGEKVVGKPRYLTDQFRMPYSDWQPDGNYPPKNCYLLEYDEKGKVYRRLLTKDDRRGPTGTEKSGPHVSEVLADDAAKFLRSYDGEDPWFMYLAFPTPHDPRQAPEKYRKMYPVENIELPPSYLAQHPFDNGHIVLRDELLAPWPRTELIARQHLSDYYAIITHLDAQIGRVIATLKERGLYENTLIVMAGDSGLAVGSHGLMGKQNLYDEGGIHVPFILSGGVIEKSHHGRREDALCYIHDLYPTVCELTGVAAPDSVTGKSLEPVINGKADQIRDEIYHAYRQHQRAYRRGDLKLIEYVRAPDRDKKRGDIVSGSRVTQLFDLASDPWETFNLADFPQHQKKLAEMRAAMKAKA